MKYILKYSLVLILMSCSELIDNRNSGSSYPLIEKRVRLMLYAVTPYPENRFMDKKELKSSLKLITYGDLYCEPCWKNIPRWNTIIKDFNEFSNLTFLCYINATPEDFDRINEEAKLNFPVLLDSKSRFKAVNGIGKNPNETTFLLDKDNKIVMTGDPFNPIIKKKYLDIIKSYESK